MDTSKVTRVEIQAGEIAELVMPASEVCLHMGITGRRMFGLVSDSGRSVQLIDAVTLELFSIPILTSEAGIYTRSDGTMYTYLEEV